MPRTSSTNPPYAETVAKYIKESNADPATVAADIAKYAIHIGFPENLDFAAWHWVRKQGLAPPPLNQGVPFTTLDKPYVTMADGLKVLPNTGYTIRGYFLHGKLGVTKKGKDMYIFSMVDESGSKDVLVFGDKVKAANDFGKTLKSMDKIRLTGITTMVSKEQPVPALSGGDYTGFMKIVNDPENSFNIPKFTSIKTVPLRALEIFEGALVRGNAYSYEVTKYVGCPNCKSKFRDNTQAGRPAECNDREVKGGGKRKGCGIVESKELVFTTLVIVDNKFDVKLKLNPDMVISEEKLKEITDELKPVWAVGSLQKNDTFRVDWYELEENLGGPAPRADSGIGIPAPATSTTVQNVSTANPTPTPPVSVPNTTVIVANVPNNPPLTVAPVNGPNSAMSSSAMQRYIDDDLMEFMNVFQGTATVDGILSFFGRRSVAEDTAKSILLEAIMQKKVTKDGNMVRKVTGQ